MQSLSFKLLNLFVTKENKWTMQPVLLRPLLEEASSSCKEQINNKRIKISIDCPDIMLMAEADLLKSLFINLIDNAIKSIEETGHIEIHAREAAEQMTCIEIKDDGRGMPDSEIKHITEAFYRIDKSRSRAQGGAGLGLTLCNEIVHLHGGSLTFRSREQSGTCATVFLKGAEELCKK